VLLECQYTKASGSDVEVTWKRNSITLHEHKEETLQLLNVKSQESGNYSCTLTDGAHVDTITHTLLVQGRREQKLFDSDWCILISTQLLLFSVPPEPPVLHARRFSGNGSTTLSWRILPSLSSPILGFSLNHRPVDGEWEEEMNLDKKKISHEFRLEPGQCFSKTYEVFLTAYNAIGTSLPSESLRLEVEGPFSFPPVSTTISYNATAITFNFSTWNLFECDNPLVSVEYRSGGESPWILGSVSNWTEGLVIPNLPAEKEYDVRLRVESGGESELVQEFKLQLSQNSLLNQQNLSGLYRDAVVVVVPLGLALVAISSAAAGTLIFWWRRRTGFKHVPSFSTLYPVPHNFFY